MNMNGLFNTESAEYHREIKKNNSSSVILGVLGV